MTYRYSCLLGSAALTAMLSLPATAQEYSNGGICASGRGPATMTPYEAFGVHPPGLAPDDARHWKPYVPYYAPLSPVASSTRWRPWSYHFLLPYYTPYYMGYSPNRHRNPPPRPYGSNGWGDGPRPEMPVPEEPGTTPLNYAAYTSVIDDDTTYWNMGGNGLVPYGAPQPATVRAPDLIDAIQASRPHRHFRRVISKAAAAIVPPPESVVVPGVPEPLEGAADGESHRRLKSDEPLPAGEALMEEGDDTGTERRGAKPRKSTTPSSSGAGADSQS